MVIKLLSTQIPAFWELLKQVTSIVDEVKKEDLQQYLIELLHSLLSDKTQCWFRLDDKRTIIAILITRFKFNKISGTKSLYIQCLYSYKQVPVDTWQKEFDLIVQFAKQEGCKNITFNSRHPRIWEIAKIIGCKEQHRSFAYNLE